jgi:hypothetical protein
MPRYASLARQTALALVLGILGQPICYASDVESFRDDAVFWQRVRGVRDSKQVRPNPDNIELLVAKAELVYRPYLRTLYRGFIAEASSDLPAAERYYKRCLSVPVHEEQSYYTNPDLARIALKRSDTTSATKYLRTYLWYQSQEIKAGEGELTDVFFGYVPGPAAIAAMKRDRRDLQRVLSTLRKNPSRASSDG